MYDHNEVFSSIVAMSSTDRNATVSPENDRTTCLSDKDNLVWDD